ncbi:histidine phosphatase family protein [Peptostreptococcus porci]|uniref:histidine phosphatase family protein n=1 Tax=Peptostreptococcus porci TaxID=2652282 RepID=UPI002A91E1C2|nr:histidine phosphatase family protein [Peptostreptococcus porci]MDY6232435.1 histidine phosphatase family protein [Peptostreptococcus porci]
MRKLYLVRHATPNFKDDIRLCIGKTDIDIGNKGIDESKKLRDFFSKKQINSIFSSPLSRCVSTAEIISDGKLEVNIDAGLMEIDMGEWEGIPIKDIVKELGDEPSNGERRVDALKRMENAIIEIMNNTAGDVICVAHAGVNCAFIAKVIGADIKTSRAIRQPYASYSCFEYENFEFKCLEIGILPEKESELK